jgi:hypothetical protein
MDANARDLTLIGGMRRGVDTNGAIDFRARGMRAAWIRMGAIYIRALCGGHHARDVKPSRGT